MQKMSGPAPLRNTSPVRYEPLSVTPRRYSPLRTSPFPFHLAGTFRYTKPVLFTRIRHGEALSGTRLCFGGTDDVFRGNGWFVSV